MKEILQLLRASSPEIAEALPRPPRPGYIVVRTLASVVSAGTERMLVEFAQAGMLGKARQQPERVKQMADKVRTDGFAATMGAVRSRLGEPTPHCPHGGCSPVGAHLVGHLLHPFGLLPGLTEHARLSEFHQHPLGSRRHD